jgi:hypothetical protein
VKLQRGKTTQADAPRVEEIAFTGTNAFLQGNSTFKPQAIPLMVAVEKGELKDVVAEHGATRILVVGDSVFLANHQLDLMGNRDFAGTAINWLLDRTQLLGDIGPRPVIYYRLVMTKAQLRSTQTILLVGMPGAILGLGVVVWFRRRN